MGRAAVKIFPLRRLHYPIHPSTHSCSRSAQSLDDTVWEFTSATVSPECHVRAAETRRTRARSSSSFEGREKSKGKLAFRLAITRYMPWIYWGPHYRANINWCGTFLTKLTDVES